jgi:hypothetical protein
VTETEAIVCKRVVVLGTDPVKLNGILISNSPPKAWDPELWNQRAAFWLRSAVNCDVDKLKPWAGLNVTFSEVRLRLVEYPIISRVKLEAVSLAACTLVRTGAEVGIVNCKVVSEGGITVTPPAVVNVGVRVTVSATVPVCRRI